MSTIRFVFRGCALCVLFLVSGISLFAQNGGKGLYGEGAPEDAAFVRIANAVSGSEPLEADIGAVRFEGIEYSTVSPYRPVTPGIYRLQIGEDREEIIPEKGRYYTVVHTDSGLRVLEDEEHTRPDRAQLFLYNFSTRDTIDLRTADGTVTIVAEVETGESGLAVVNPVPIAPAVYAGDELLSALEDPGLERGDSYSIFVLGSGEEIHAFIEQAEIGTE